MTLNVSDFLHERVKVETCCGTVEGLLKHVDYYLSKHSRSLRPSFLILSRDSNPGGLIIVRSWKAIKQIDVCKVFNKQTSR